MRSSRRPVLGAVFALLGFVSQYPVPAIHRCPVMNPNGIAVIVGAESGASSAQAADDHADHTSHADHESHAHRPHDAHGDHQNLPPCHRALALATAAKAGESGQSQGHSHNHAGHGQTTAGDEGGHSHDSCPVCQGHAQLIQGLPSPALPALTTLYQFHAHVALFAQTFRVLHTTNLPPARAPPVLSAA